jgi:hypothetical protein
MMIEFEDDSEPGNMFTEVLCQEYQTKFSDKITANYIGDFIQFVTIQV